MKHFLAFCLLFFVASCSSGSKSEYDCPEILIPRETTRIYQSNGKYDEFQINLVGSESYCYTEPSTNRRYAVITPLFKIRRLEKSNISTIDIEFFVKTSQNAEDYLGTRNFHQTLKIPTSSKEEVVKGRQTSTRITMPPYNDFTIYLGIKQSEYTGAKVRKMFDIDYSYLSDEEIAEQNNPTTENVYLEVNSDEEIIYSDSEKKPIVVKKNRPSNNCQN